MTPSTHSPTRQINHASAIADAEDSYAEDARAQYQGATEDRIKRDVLELENLARLICGLAKNGSILIGRTEFAQVPAPSYPVSTILVEAYEHEMTPAAHAVLSVLVAKMESEK